jgi:hypothetical protein
MARAQCVKEVKTNYSPDNAIATIFRLDGSCLFCDTAPRFKISIAFRSFMLNTAMAAALA